MQNGTQRHRSLYLTILAVGAVAEPWLANLLGDGPMLFGQPFSVLFSYFYVGIAAFFWVITRSQSSSGLKLRLFLFALLSTWLAHVLLYRVHGDAFNYSSFLVPFILFLFLMRPPNLATTRLAILMYSWTILIALCSTLAVESAGLRQQPAQLPGIVNFDESNYFLPLNELLGITGRWSGPFGHNGDTAMMGALLIVIAVAFWSRASWVFLVVGALTLILTNGRASIGAAAVGLVVVFMFTSWVKVDRIPRKWRITSGLFVLALGAMVMFLRPAGLTGRERIWPAFLDLWRESPWIGVGGSGFANGNEITRQFGHAHSLYIEELARSGLVGFISLSIALGIGIWIAAKATRLGYPGPLAVMATYFVTGITEPRNNWIEPSATGFLLILVVLAASAKLHEQRREVTVQPLRS